MLVKGWAALRSLSLDVNILMVLATAGARLLPLCLRLPCKHKAEATFVGSLGSFVGSLMGFEWRRWLSGSARAVQPLGTVEKPRVCTLKHGLPLNWHAPDTHVHDHLQCPEQAPSAWGTSWRLGPSWSCSG